jgi:hypothetical protein
MNKELVVYSYEQGRMEEAFKEARSCRADVDGLKRRVE